MRVCVCACGVCVCVRACVHARVCVCECANMGLLDPYQYVINHDKLSIDSPIFYTPFWVDRRQSLTRNILYFPLTFHITPCSVLTIKLHLID